MKWVVLGEENGKIKLVSKNDMDTKGILPKGSYLTVEYNETKFILRVDSSSQHVPYSPSPMVVDMDLSPLKQDQKCQNIIYAYRVKDITTRTDGLIDYILPQTIARKSSQEEIDLALDCEKEGPNVFLSTIYSGRNQILKDDDNKLIKINLPEDMFFHQVLICGKTGSGKTVASKYLAQYFVEHLEGAVLAINVKDVDFLKMDKPSKTNSSDCFNEWKELDQTSHGIDNFTIYYPANTEIEQFRGLNYNLAKKVTLDIKKLDPESLVGLLQGISDSASQSLPSIFRYWKEEIASKNPSIFTFNDFINYFYNGENDQLEFRTLNNRGVDSRIKLHRGTFDNILRNLNEALDFFDNEEALSLDETDILVRGKMSVINVASRKGTQFGSILLRDLLHRIVEAKSTHKSDVPILIIIDEVHQFYNTASSRQALGDLDVICRTGRSQKIGVLFSSQNPSDIPKGLSTVINTKIFFKTDSTSVKTHGIAISNEEMESLKPGFAVSSIHGLSQVKTIKFPLSLAGVLEEE
ncbi:ATP-binding protein [Methanococcoides methylutens]|uniref:Bipolar DNA helicase HerA n=1 Tax=Methanococcoides methylutens MM1 TaxID=1434104 RepID=A0A0E3STJ2_METMT|nr:ATP-binding protein [Methanococcoides methylutens]AKB85992.1 Bipolar DNA helicase HerA [Methanococcoides methylutens MM1]